MKRALFVLGMGLLPIWILLAGWFPSVHAQDDPEPTPTAAIAAYHIIGQDETLFQIALDYGVTVEAILVANNITDPRFLEVGQRLVIPNAEGSPALTWGRHVVQAGETLYTLALQYQINVQTLAEINHLTQNNRLYVGQVLDIPQGSERRTDLVFYAVQAGDTPLRLALNFNIPLATLQALNGWTDNTILTEGERIVVTGQSGASFLELPYPMTYIMWSPMPAVQGKTISLHFSTAEPVTSELNFMGRTVQVAEYKENEYYALLGVHALTETGVYPATLSLTTTSGYQVEYAMPFLVEKGDYGFENIDVPPEQEGLLDPAVVQNELNLITTVMSQFSTTPHFSGLLDLPSAAEITSDFGTRRSYANSSTLSFHGGTDFGGATGSPITAPASGTVVLARSLQVRGNVIVIDHGWGVYTGYWHQQETYVQEGEFVERGRMIGVVGSTGLSTGAHLHWEMWVSGVQVDPLQWTQIVFPQ